MNEILLGTGPVAEVYATSIDGRPVALKVFPAKLDRRTLAAVERERIKLSTLSAPILAVDGIELRDGKHALRMELCVESLTARVRRTGPLGKDDVVLLGHSLSRALAAAHEAGIPHGGVSPDNVLYRVTGEPVLADFGVLLREAFSRDPLHSIEYLAPETLRTGVVNERSDLYGLGAVLHFALTGGSPHPGKLGEQPGERVLRVLSNPVPAVTRPDVPVSLTTLAGRLLAVDPEKRPPDAAGVAKQLAGVLPESSTDFIKPVRPKPSRLRYLALAGAAVVVVGLTIFLITQGGSDPPATPPSTAAAAAPVKIELAELDDRRDSVALTWTANRNLDFAVVVIPDGEREKVSLAQRNHSTTVPVDPARKYCFLIRGTESDHIYESQTKCRRPA